ncbi:hypothetical protein ACIQGO_30675 [Streptomyces shenzhenensis]
MNARRTTRRRAAAGRPNRAIPAFLLPLLPIMLPPAARRPPVTAAERDGLRPGPARSTTSP